MPVRDQDLANAQRYAMTAIDHKTDKNVTTLVHFMAEKHISVDDLALSKSASDAVRYMIYRDKEEKRLRTVDADPTWRRRNDLAPGIPVHMSLETALDEIRRVKHIYPVVRVHPTHPLGIQLFQFREDKLPNRQVFCNTPALRDRVLVALISNTLTRHP